MRRVMLASALVMAAACKPQATLLSDADVAAQEAAIRQVDSSIVAAGNAHDIEAFLASIADDARMLPPGAPPVVGKDAIRSLLTAFMSPEFAVAHHLEEVVVSRGGDLGYVSYTYELTFRGPDGAPVTETGKDISIYKRAADGSWKLAIDMWNEDEPPSPSM